MNELTSFLDAQGFTKAAKIETLKVTLSPVKHEDTNVDIPSPDKRYYWDGKAFGLHISSIELKANEWIQLIDLLEINSDFVQILSIVNTNLEGFYPNLLPNLTFVNLSQNKKLNHINLANCSQLTTFKASHCPKLTQVELNGKFEQLNNIDISFCGELAKLRLPNTLNSLRFLNVSNGNLNELRIPKQAQ
ncbi:hypothetical protein P1X15_08935 [Runella sp. MFBS21]|uniref:hypothetical protein n=1 Tax=Runella sp. MFBS21 TaxID=3034018 RepID=UPI0023F82500|nr:hypothetical protein [Runella sp. MFBS21]MDF7817720.1 hypothetical protein [Runella sp. MFBS21]